MLKIYNDNSQFTFGWTETAEIANARTMVVTMKKILRPQSSPDGLNHMKRIPEIEYVAR